MLLKISVCVAILFFTLTAMTLVYNGKQNTPKVKQSAEDLMIPPIFGLGVEMGIIKDICSNPDAITMLENGLIIDYSATTPAGISIVALQVKKSDCEDLLNGK